MVVEDLLDDRPLRDCRDDLELPNAAVRAVLHWQCNSRMQRKPPDQAAPNRPLLSACSWPGPGFHLDRRKLIVAGKAIAPKVRFLAPPRTPTDGHEPSPAAGSFRVS